MNTTNETKNETIEKECEICGAIFKTANSQRKYCDDCSAHTASRQREYNRAYRDSYNRMYEPKILTLTCDECGKEFKTISKCKIKSNEDNVQYVFCNPSCQRKHVERYERAHNFCLNCGKFVENYPEKYCSEACKEEHAIRIAEQNGSLHTCQFCGKRFIRNGAATFCGQECYKRAVKNGWRPAKPAPVSVTVNEICENCGKVYERAYAPGQLRERLIPRFCSASCKAEYDVKLRLAQERKQKQQDESLARAMNAEGKAKAKAEEDRTEPLCTTCKTPYVDCDRMSSNFRILPKGAAYNMHGVLVVCPQYTEGKKKQKQKKSITHD